jgi:hypothetical protein
MEKVRIVVIRNTIAPYRHPLFEELAKRVKLNVYYSAVKHEIARKTYMIRRTCLLSSRGNLGQ